jgi:hypothetical protein
MNFVPKGEHLLWNVALIIFVSGVSVIQGQPKGIPITLCSRARPRGCQGSWVGHNSWPRRQGSTAAASPGQRGRDGLLRSGSLSANCCGPHAAIAHFRIALQRPIPSSPTRHSNNSSLSSIVVSLFLHGSHELQM